ncbi:MAG: hypothetical protein WC690_05665, partial [bacterium]
LKRLSDSFMHLRDLEPYEISGLPIQFEFLTEGVDLNAKKSPATAIDEFEIKNEALHTFAVRTAIDTITDRAAQQSIAPEGNEISRLILEWNPSRREIRVLNGNPAVRSLAAFELEPVRRHLMRLRKRIGEDARIHFLRSYGPDGGRRIEGVSIHIPPNDSDTNRFEPSLEEAARLGSAFGDLAPERWRFMSDEQQGHAIESAALFAADQGLDVQEVSPEDLDGYLSSASMFMPGISIGLPVLR